MTAYFVSPDGLDTNNGRGPDASDPTNKPWLTVGKALNTGSVVVPGDTVWVAPGYYYAAGMAPIAGVSSVASPTAVRGDPLNSQGFKTAAGVRLNPGLCWLTTRTAVEGIDNLPASGGFLITPATTCHGMQWYDLVLEAKGDGSGTVWAPTITGNTDWLFQECRLIGRFFMNLTSGAPTAGFDLTIRRCVAFCNPIVNISTTTAAATADADLNIVLESNLVFGRLSGSLALGSSGGAVGGGVKCRGNTVIEMFGNGSVLATVALRHSTVTPSTAEGNLIFAGGPALNAGTAGHIVSNGHNRYFPNGFNANVTDLATDKHGPAPNWVLPDLLRWGLEMPRMDFLGWTDAAASTQRASAWTNTNPDFRGRTARPWGAGASIGYLEANAASQDVSGTITGGGSNSLKITGAGEQPLFVAVDATPTTITIWTESSSYGGTNYPQLLAQANPAIGVTAQTATATDATEQQLTIGPFTPTAPGVIELRLVSRSSSTTSSTYFDRLVRA